MSPWAWTARTVPRGTSQSWQPRVWRSSATRCWPLVRPTRRHTRTRPPSSACLTGMPTGSPRWNCRKPYTRTASPKAGSMVSGLGVFSDGSGIARFQDVDTHPDHRNQGLAGTLVYQAGQHARKEMAAQTLVIVAEPLGPAIRIYRSVGFRDAETQVQLQRQPP